VLSIICAAAREQDIEIARNMESGYLPSFTVHPIPRFFLSKRLVIVLQPGIPGNSQELSVLLNSISA
jgi:hypothetical protein